MDGTQRKSGRPGLRKGARLVAVRHAIAALAMSSAMFAGCGPFFRVGSIPVSWPMHDDADIVSLLAAGYRETVDVGRARGVKIPDDAVERTLAWNRNAPATLMPSMAVDLLRGNRIELPWLSGKVVELGKQLGVPTPVHSFMYAALKPYILGTPN